MKIYPIQIGLPLREVCNLFIRVISFDVEATTCSTYYELQDSAGMCVLNGNLQLTEKQFAQWAEDNSFITKIIVDYLGVALDLTPGIIESAGEEFLLDTTIE